jgi:hypothetical protein
VKVDVEHVRLINGDQWKITRMGVLADVMDNMVNSTAAKPNEVSFTSTLELVTSLTIQLLSTKDQSMPSNLTLEILCCFVVTPKLSSKAQIEDG